MGMILVIGLIAVGIVLYISNKTLPCGAIGPGGIECCQHKHKDSHWAIVQKNGHDTQIFWE